MSEHSPCLIKRIHHGLGQPVDPSESSVSKVEAQSHASQQGTERRIVMARALRQSRKCRASIRRPQVGHHDVSEGGKVKVMTVYSIDPHTARLTSSI